MASTDQLDWEWVGGVGGEWGCGDDPIYCPKCRFRSEIVSRNSLHSISLQYFATLGSHDSLGNRQGNNKKTTATENPKGREKKDGNFVWVNALTEVQY